MLFKYRFLALSAALGLGFLSAPVLGQGFPPIIVRSANTGEKVVQPTEIIFVADGVDFAGKRITIPLSGGDSGVVTFKGRAGVVVPANGDYTFTQISGSITNAMVDDAAGIALSKLAITGTPTISTFLRGDGSWSTLPANTVTSVFGRTGSITATIGDYSFSQISGTISNSMVDNAAAIALSKLNISGSPTSSTFVRGDGSWAVPVTTIGTTVAGGAAGAIPYLDASNVLSVDATNLAWIDSDNRLAVLGINVNGAPGAHPVDVVTSTAGTGIVASGNAPMIGSQSSMENFGRMEFGASSTNGNFSLQSVPGDGVIRTHLSTNGLGSFILTNGNEQGVFKFTTGATASADTVKLTIQHDGGLSPVGVAFASLGSPANGTIQYVTDGGVTSPSDNTCVGGSNGAIAVRIAGAWKCLK